MCVLQSNFWVKSFQWKLFKTFYSSWWMADQRPRGTCPRIARVLASVVPITSNVHYNPRLLLPSGVYTLLTRWMNHQLDATFFTFNRLNPHEPYEHCSLNSMIQIVWNSYKWYRRAVCNSWPQTRQHRWLNPDHQEANSGDQWRTVPLRLSPPTVVHYVQHFRAFSPTRMINECSTR